MKEYTINSEILKASNLTEDEFQILYHRYGNYEEPDFREKIFIQRLGKAIPSIEKMVIKAVEQNVIAYLKITELVSQDAWDEWFAPQWKEFKADPYRDWAKQWFEGDTFELHDLEEFRKEAKCPINQNKVIL